MSLSNLSLRASSSGRLSCQISANQCETKMSVNVNKNEKHVKARSEGNDIITNVIPPIGSLHNYLTFLIQIIKFQRCSCKLSFLLPPYPQNTPENLLIGCYSLNNYLFISTITFSISTSTFMLYYFIISNYYKHIMYMGAVHVVSQMLVLVHRLLW